LTPTRVSDNLIRVKPGGKAAAAKAHKAGGRSRAVTVPATRAARGFSELLNRVRYRGEVFVVERGGEPVCEISPVRPSHFGASDLADLLRSLPEPDASYWDAVEEAARSQPQLPGSPWDS
jgi:antitoxin (DNA-binding transcriptional repressor) of toxin-antitoxin stability system